MNAQITEDDYLVANDYTLGEGWTFSGSSGYKMKISPIKNIRTIKRYCQTSKK